MSNQKKVAVVLSTYNPIPSFLEEQIASLINQTYPVDIYIRDDGSKEKDSLLYLKELEKKYSNVKIEFSFNEGVFNSFFDIISYVHRLGYYDYISLSDQDDIATKNKISIAISNLNGWEHIPCLFFSRMTYVDHYLKPLGISQINPNVIGFRNAIVESSINGNLMVLNKKALELVICKKPQNFYMHDWWIYMCVSAFGKILYSPESTLLYRQHESNVIGGDEYFLSIMKKRIRRFSKFNEKTYPIIAQATEFLNMFKSELTEENRDLLQSLINSKKSLMNRIMYSMRKDVVRMKKFDNVLLRVLLICNKY